MGIKHIKTSPVHPNSNGLLERAYSFLKQLIAKAVANVPSRWEEVLNDVLLAQRATVSTRTTFTPHFLMTGRRIRLPLQTALRAIGPNEFGNRLDDLSRVLKIAREMTVESRKYNRQRLQTRATNSQIVPGDHVIIKAEERLTFTSRWDPMYIVTRVNGPVVYLRHQQTGKTKMLNREKCRIVDPDIIWDEVIPRPRRKHKGPIGSHQQPLMQSDIIPQTHPVIDQRTGNLRQTDQLQRTRRHVAHKRRRRSSDHSNDANDMVDTPPTVTPTCDRQVTSPVTRQLPTRRSTRRRRLTTRALDATDQNRLDDSDSDIDIDPVVAHFRKRKATTPTIAYQKRAKWSHIDFVYCFTRAAF